MPRRLVGLFSVGGGCRAVEVAAEELLESPTGGGKLTQSLKMNYKYEIEIKHFDFKAFGESSCKFKISIPSFEMFCTYIDRFSFYTALGGVLFAKLRLRLSSCHRLGSPMVKGQLLMGH